MASNSNYSSSSLMVLLFIACLLMIKDVFSQNTVTSLPGFPESKLPFKLETGYVGIGELEEIQMFYYLVESERNPVEDPLLVWLSGGPGCSGLSALLFEIGPIKINVEAWNGSLPVPIAINRDSWTKVANILFIDQPVGTGFSYATTQGSYNTSDTLSADQLYTFLKKWVAFHPRFLTNPLYLGGDAYSGITLPLLVNNVVQGMEEGDQPMLNFQGYVLGNPVTDFFIDHNHLVPLSHRLSLISDSQYKNAKLFCYNDYVNINSSNALCVAAIQTIKENLLQINMYQTLEPQCAFITRRRKDLEWDLKEEESNAVEYIQSVTTLSPHSRLPELRCRKFGYMLSNKWANDPRVLDALHVRNGTVKSWQRCAKSLPYYTKDINSTITYHKNFTNLDMRVLIYSGEHDLSVPYIGTIKWIKSLDIPIFEEWRPWFVDGQVGGYTMKFVHITGTYSLTYATVKGAGLTAPEYKPKPTLKMIDRFFAQYPI